MVLCDNHETAMLVERGSGEGIPKGPILMDLVNSYFFSLTLLVQSAISSVRVLKVLIFIISSQV